ncbi:hypothetical protein ACKKBF_B36440 [Auxenochlorella protothecoides x Auxenochlorella symbiontica]
MRTRSRAGAVSGAKDPEEDASPSQEVEDAEEATSGSDDEAPEEEQFEASKKSAAEKRQDEKKARQAASAQKKQQRRSRGGAAEASQGPEQPAAENEDRPGPPAEARPTVADDAEAGDTSGAEEELDLLPNEVLDAVAQTSALNPQRARERSIVSQHLRAGMGPQSSARKRRRVVKGKATGRVAGPVTVKVLGAVQSTHASESARAFLKLRRYGTRVERSTAMLRPVRVDGV